MSRWWPEAPCVSLGWQVAAPDADARAQQIEQTLAEFDQALAGLAPAGLGGLRRFAQVSTRLPVHVRLTGGLTRWQVLPFNDSLRGADQHRLFAQHCFTQACGERARQWTILAEPPRWNRNSLACGIDTALLDALESRARRAGRRLGRVEPALTATHNAVRRQLDDAVYWLVLVEAGLSTALLMHHGEALRIKSVARGVDLGRLLDREWFALGLHLPRCPVVLVGDVPDGAADVPGWTLQRPAHRPAGADARSAQPAASARVQP